MALVSPVQMLGLSMLGCRKAGLVVPRASDTETPQVLADAAVVVVFCLHRPGTAAVRVLIHVSC